MNKKRYYKKLDQVLADFTANSPSDILKMMDIAIEIAILNKIDKEKGIHWVGEYFWEMRKKYLAPEDIHDISYEELNKMSLDDAMNMGNTNNKVH
jgi:hypothetical protein